MLVSFGENPHGSTEWSWYRASVPVEPQHCPTIGPHPSFLPPLSLPIQYCIPTTTSSLSTKPSFPDFILQIKQPNEMRTSLTPTPPFEITLPRFFASQLMRRHIFSFVQHWSFDLYSRLYPLPLYLLYEVLHSANKTLATSLVLASTRWCAGAGGWFCVSSPVCIGNITLTTGYQPWWEFWPHSNVPKLQIGGLVINLPTGKLLLSRHHHA